MNGSSIRRGGLRLFGPPLLAGAALRAYSLHAYLTGNPFATHLFSDAHAYMSWAARIASGDAPAEPFYQAPLYPHFVALLVRIAGENLAWIYAAQSVLGLLSIALTAAVARRFLPLWVASVAATLYALHPYPVFFEMKVYPDTLGTTAALLAIGLAARAGRSSLRWGGAGAAAGLAALARANFLLAGLLLFAYLARKGERRGALFFAAGLLLLLAPAAAWNRSHGGGWILVAANGGEVFYHGNNGNARGGMGLVPELGAEIESLAERSRRAASERLGGEVTAAGASAFWFAEGLRWIAGHPAASLRLELRKLRLLLSARFAPLGSFYSFEAGRFGAPPRPLALLHYPLLFLALAALLRREARRRIPPPVLILAATEAATVLLFFVCTRYLLPLYPAIALLAGAGLSFGFRRRGRLVAAFLLLPLALLLLADQQTPPRRATPYAQLASIRSAAGEREKAIALYAEALRLAPFELRHYQNLAREKERAGDLAGAVAVLRRGEEARLLDGRTYGYLGALLARSGRPAEAEEKLREALRLEPGRARSHYELGLVLERSGRHAEAEAELTAACRLDRENVPFRAALLRLYEGPLADRRKAGAVAREIERLRRRGGGGEGRR